MGLNITNITNDYKKLNKKIHNVWKKYFSNGNISGFGGIIFNNIQPTSIDDFYEKQQKYANKNIKLKKRERGLTYDEIIELAYELKEKCESSLLIEKFDIEYYINYIIYVNYIQTFNGKIGEIKVKDALKNLGYDVRLSNNKEDNNYGLDVIFGKNGKLNNGIQLKHFTFLLSNEESVLEDINELKEKYYKSINDLGIETYYLFYNKFKSGYYCFENDKCLISFNDLNEKILNKKINERKEYLNKLSIKETL
jgi:hypothetical protein